MQMQGRVTDGQYINAPFIAEMNAPILDFLRNYGEENLLDISDVSDEYWWPVQWDPGHWLDKVFNAFKETPFVNRLLKRTALYHQLFGHGKMHSVVKETAKELALPFKVTNTFAQQRFMSSSYLPLKNLANSLETYIETFKDHDNRMNLGYRLYGQDFVVDLLGLLDLLWPLVVLMLEGQAQWCPGWKFARHVPKVEKQLRNIIEEMKKKNPAATICPRLGAHMLEVKDFKFGKSELVEGWLVVEEAQGKPVKWNAREVPDCVRDLKNLGENMVEELKARFENP